MAKRAFGSQKGFIGKKAMPFGNPPHHGTNKCGLSQFFLFSTFLGAAGVLFAVCVLVAIFRGWYTILQFQPHQGGQMQLGFDGNPILLSGWCCMAHAAIFTGTGSTFSNAARDVCGAMCG